MLLSYKKEATASSSLQNHEPHFGVNEDIRTWWCAIGSTGQWYTVDLGKVYRPHSVQINFAEAYIPIKKMPKIQRSGSITTGSRYTDSGTELRLRYLLEGSTDGEQWFMLRDSSGETSDNSHPYIILEENTDCRYVRISCLETPYNSAFALSGLRVFGLDVGNKPAAVNNICVRFDDPMTAMVSWDAVPDALGYNLRYGIDKDKLYTSHLVYELPEVLLGALNANQDYWFCVDSFNECGITKGVVQQMKETPAAI